MKIEIFLFSVLLLACSLFSFPPEDFVEDNGKFLAENQRSVYRSIAMELREKTGFSLYLYTADENVQNAGALADSLCELGEAGDSLRAVVFLDASGNHRAFKASPHAKKWISDEAVERLAQKYLLPEFRKENAGNGILLFCAEVAKNVARLNDVRLQAPMPRPSKDGIPTVAWLLLFAVFAAVIIAYAYFVRQSAQAKKRSKIREFGGFPHQKFDSGFGG